ncbi:MAG: alpha-amylase [Candidatus Lokiarchaeota archaeon]|nr:alpha-amylase [Candidatus Lokiarchaeota archaeon]
MENINYIPEWTKDAVIYHIYPLGFFGAPRFGKAEQDTVPRLEQIRVYYDHFEDLGVNTIQFGPLFESERHGYDTIEYFKIDHRLGTNEVFKKIVAELHDRNIRVVVDGVFNHVSREFPSFKDVQAYRENSWRKHWHFIDFSKDNPRGDGFDYKTWEGHYNLVKLNLAESDVKNHIFSAARYWLGEIGIDGWRLDVAYLLPYGFLQEFRSICKMSKPDCLLVGEAIHGPYSKLVGSAALDAATGFQVQKSIWSAFNNRNLFELKAILERSFHPQWGQERNVTLVNFLGNHDTNRISSQLDDKRNLYPAVLLLFTLNGIPKIYYGDEIGLLGKKIPTSDDPVRQAMPPYPFDLSKENFNLLNHYKLCIRLRKNHHALKVGNLVSLHAGSHELAFMRQSSRETLLIAISSASETTSMSIPLWNLELEGKIFVEQLEQGGAKEYRVERNRLHIPEIYPHWGRILKLE